MTDHGPGTTEDFRDRIFGKVAQAEPSDARQKGGTGLGLSISKAIVEHHARQIGLDTELGIGTTFHFDPPIAKATTMPAPQPDTRRGCVLTCEGDAEAAGLIRGEIKKLDLGAETAGSPADARARLESGHYLAVTPDLTLPEDGAVGLFRYIRANPFSK